MTRPSERGLRVYTIGQTPRPDLTSDLRRAFPGVALDLVGALDGLSREAIDGCDGCLYPLETRLRDGSRIVVDAAYVEARIQRSLDAFAGDTLAHLILCAGPFPALTVPQGSGGPAPPLIRPFDTGVEVLRERGWSGLAVLVPFPAQATPAARKWRAQGFDLRGVRALSDRPPTASVATWVASWVRDLDADAVVFDYVGFPGGLLAEVAAATALPVLDLGRLALDRLAATLLVS